MKTDICDVLQRQPTRTERFARRSARRLLRVAAVMMLLSALFNIGGLPALGHSLTSETIDPMTPPMRDRLNRAKRLVPVAPESSAPLSLEFRQKLLSVVDKVAVWPVLPLNGCFFGGDGDLERMRRRQVHLAAEEWSKGRARLFDFGQAPGFRTCDEAHPSQVRVAFWEEKNGDKIIDSWGCIGRFSLKEGDICGQRNRPSLNLNPLRFGSGEEELRIAAMHELGHALGLEHEHQHKDCTGELDLDKIKVNYRDLYTPDVIDAMFGALVGEKFDFRTYDKTSIMHYWIKASFFKDGAGATCYLATPNRTISSLDFDAIRTYYTEGGTSLDISSLLSSSLSGLDLDVKTKRNLGTELAGVLSAGAQGRHSYKILFKPMKDLGVETKAAKELKDREDRPFVQPTECASGRPNGKATCRLSSDGNELEIIVEP